MQEGDNSVSYEHPIRVSSRPAASNMFMKQPNRMVANSDNHDGTSEGNQPLLDDSAYGDIGIQQRAMHHGQARHMKGEDDNDEETDVE